MVNTSLVQRHVLLSCNDGLHGSAFGLTQESILRKLADGDQAFTEKAQKIAGLKQAFFGITLNLLTSTFLVNPNQP